VKVGGWCNSGELLLIFLEPGCAIGADDPIGLTDSITGGTAPGDRLITVRAYIDVGGDGLAA
jgi:hypothetical protein